MFWYKKVKERGSLFPRFLPLILLAVQPGLVKFIQTFAMAMRKCITSGGIELSYLEQNESADTVIFFVHGNSSSAHIWEKQFISPRLSHYRLIAFDLPGHGQSQQLEKEKYNVVDFAGALVDGIKQLSCGAAYFFAGFSLGSNIVVELLACGLKPAGIILLGPCILGSGFTLMNIGKEGANLAPLFSESATDEDLYACIAEGCLSTNEKDHQRIYEDYKAAVPAVRPAILQSGLDEKYNDEIALLQQYHKPVLIIFGADEKMINPHYLDAASLPLWEDKVHKIRGGSHFIHIDQQQAVNHLLGDYIEFTLAGSHTLLHSSATL